MSRKTLSREISSLLSKHVGEQCISVNEPDLFRALRLEGDDVNDFLDEFELQFGVDMSNFVWYFHYNADEPPMARRVVPILSGGEIAPYQPIAFCDLVRAAESGCWIWEYPEHHVRNRWWRNFVPGPLWLFVIVGLLAIIIC